MRNKSIAALLVLALMAATAFAGDAMPVKARLHGYDVAWISLSTPMTLTNAAGEKVVHERAYLIRLHGEFPLNRAERLRLFFGDQPIGEFGGLGDGLYFMVFDRVSLDALAGKEIRVQFGAQPMQSLGAVFDPRRFEPFRLMSEKEAFFRRP
jgi:hypothetical protein